MASVTDADLDLARLSLTKLAIPPPAADAHVVADELKLKLAHPSAGANIEIRPRDDVDDDDHVHDHIHEQDRETERGSKPDYDRDRDDASLHTPVETVSSPASSCVITSPPYWLNPTPRDRGETQAPIEGALPAGAITLRDNDTPDDDRNSACWAKSVEIPGHTLVGGSALPTSIGAFVVWNIRVETLNGSYLHIRKRYSEFDEFRSKLVATFPGFRAAMPKLPPKSLVYKLRPEFLEKRRAGLEYFLNCILLNPEFSGSPILKDFLFA
ncbi:PX domain-containing protein YPT35 [Escovopsis weberi]|uniref:Endosomal/vacuolar adapter protein YPT35 n=1 Tax=Escovopsis weberi TaxID=150374 RepID=A0A0M8N6F4_ESCWE|nr:PX domain-containing protein YPT35 [Escovopsis weberi]